MTDALGAARFGDEITHGWGMLGLAGGALLGAAVGAALVVAGVATGGLAIVAIVGGCIAGGGLAGGSLLRGITRHFNLPGPTSGLLGQGSPNVRVNGRPAMRAGVDFAPSCSGTPMNHTTRPHVLIAEGSRTVRVNGMPMARLGSQLVCGAKIRTSSSNVFVGGPTAQVASIDDNEALVERGFEILGIAALAAAGVGALAAGGLATLTFGAIVLGTNYGMKAVHSWGESLGPGYGDIMVGLTGFAMLGLGAKGAATPKGRAAVDVLNRTELSSEGLGSNGGNLKIALRQKESAVSERLADSVGTGRTAELSAENALILRGDASRAQIVQAIGEAAQPSVKAIRKLDPEALVGFRGSLATGLKNEAKLGPNGERVAFDGVVATKNGASYNGTQGYDADFFIMSDKLAADLGNKSFFRDAVDLDASLGGIFEDFGQSMQVNPVLDGMKVEPPTFRVFNSREIQKKLNVGDGQIYFIPGSD